MVKLGKAMLIEYGFCRHCYKDQSMQGIGNRYKTHPHIPAHNFLNIQWQSAKSFGKLRLRAFQPYHLYYICRHCRYKTRISNAFNAIYVNTLDTKHIHTFLLITSMDFQSAKSFGKLRLRDTTVTRQGNVKLWYITPHDSVVLTRDTNIVLNDCVLWSSYWQCRQTSTLIALVWR